MTGFIIILMMLRLGWIDIISFTPQPVIDKNYRAAEYSLVVDFSSVKEFMPELANMVPSSVVTNRFYLQYGKDAFIEITDPGHELRYVPVTIVKWDYSKGELTVAYIFDHLRKYRTSTDTISFSIDECNGIAENLCDRIAENERCDSVSFVSQSTNTQYYVYFNDTIANLPSRDLLYPDIKYLPSKIIRIGKSKNYIRNLEQVIYGKESVDFILNLYDYKGYERISDKEWNHRDPQIDEVIEKLKKFENNK